MPRNTSSLAARRAANLARVHDCRNRRRAGIQLVPVEVRPWDVARLTKAGLLPEDEQQDRAALALGIRRLFDVLERLATCEEGRVAIAEVAPAVAAEPAPATETASIAACAPTPVAAAPATPPTLGLKLREHILALRAAKGAAAMSPAAPQSALEIAVLTRGPDMPLEAELVLDTAPGVPKRELEPAPAPVPTTSAPTFEPAWARVRRANSALAQPAGQDYSRERFEHGPQPSPP